MIPYPDWDLIKEFLFEFVGRGCSSLMTLIKTSGNQYFSRIYDFI